jgi:two-component sensor histidine kinase
LNEEQSGPVTLDFRINDVELTPDLAVPLGLILNEFVTNSLKYAFDGKGGAIVVSVEACRTRSCICRSATTAKAFPASRRPPGRARARG